MTQYFTYILLSTWPILQLIKIYSLEGNLYALDILKPLPILLLCITLVMMFLQKRRIRIGSPFILWFIYFLYLLFNYILNGSSEGAQRICTDQYNISIMPLALYFIIENLGPNFNRKTLVFSIIISGLIIAGIGLAEFIAGHNLIGENYLEGIYIQSVYRTNGPFHEAIGYSTIVLLYIPFIYYYLKEKIISKIMFFSLFIIYSMGFVVTLSRASIISYLIVLLVCFSRSNVKSIFINLYLSVMLLLCLYLSWELIINSKLFVKRFANPSGVIARWSQYKESLSIFIDNPLTGIGYGIYKKTHFYFIHNSYLKDLVEFGIFGLLTHVIFISSVAFSNIKMAFLVGKPHSIKVRLSIIIILAIVPNTIDLLNNQYFILILFVMIAVLNLNPESNLKPIIMPLPAKYPGHLSDDEVRRVQKSSSPIASSAPNFLASHSGLLF